MKKTLVILCIATMLIGGAGLANATTITDGFLVIDVESGGRLKGITLDGKQFDTTWYPQQQYVNGANLSSGSTVTVSGSTASYTAWAGDFNVRVESSILGPLPSYQHSRVFEQTFVFTNTSSDALYLESVSFIDADLDNTWDDDTVAYDNATNSVFATDSPFMLAATVDDSAATSAWDVGILHDIPRPISFDTLRNTVGPLGPGDTEMAIGLDYGYLDPGQDATLTYRYLFANGSDGLPSDFRIDTAIEACNSVPEPTTLFLVGSGLLGLVGCSRKFRKS